MNAPRDAGGVPKRAMVLSAGKGLRLRPITETKPKPLVEIHGKPLLDHALDRLADASVEEAVVNLHYLGEQILTHLKGRLAPKIIFSEEAELLETGGGIKKALPLLGDDPFIVVNSDVLWLDGATPMLRRLAGLWDDSAMDALLLLHPTSAAVGYHGGGDYRMDPLGRLSYRQERFVPPFVYAGVQIAHPRLFAGAPEGAFSLKPLLDRAEEAGRLYGLRHDGLWCHVGSPEEMREVEEMLLLELGKPRREARAAAG